jgi:uncharacterized repeat protein (TIGR03803 family)
MRAPCERAAVLRTRQKMTGDKHLNLTRTCLLGACALSALAAMPRHAAATPIDIIHRFVKVQQGARPRAPLTGDAAGNLYGTTYTGSADGNGAVFELSPPANGSKKWVETVLHHFSKNVKDGVFPWSSVIPDSSGNLYGTTSEGGKNDAGVVYELIRPTGGVGAWQYVVLFRFNGGSWGGTPDGTLVFGPDGALYGTAGYGGTGGAGIVFRLSSNGGDGHWTETILYPFDNQADGGYPFSTLIFDTSGNIYGTTLNGGNTGNGVVFELAPADNGATWTESVLHSFDSQTDGMEPRTGVTMDAKGNLYGTTEIGGTAGYGAVFQVSPPAQEGGAWTETVLHSFGFSPDGGTPGYSNLVFDTHGNLYGTTETGGTLKNGVVFKLSRSKGVWTEKVLHTFSGAPDGSEPESGLLPLADGSFIGTTLEGGTVNNYGTIYQVKP